MAKSKRAVSSATSVYGSGSSQLDGIRCPLCRTPMVARMTSGGPAIVCRCSHPHEFFIAEDPTGVLKRARNVGMLTPSEQPPALSAEAEVKRRLKAHETLLRRITRESDRSSDRARKLLDPLPSSPSSSAATEESPPSKEKKPRKPRTTRRKTKKLKRAKNEEG